MVGLFTYWVSQGFVLRRITVVVEGIVEKVRLRIVGKIRWSDLASIENIGRAPTYNAVSTHAMNISRGATGTVKRVFVSCPTLLCIPHDPVTFRLRRFWILAVAAASVIVIFNTNQAKVNGWMTTAIRQDNQFVQAFGELIDGFKELKMNSAKVADFIQAPPGAIGSRVEGIANRSWIKVKS